MAQRDPSDARSISGKRGLKVPQLKVYLRNHKLTVSGKKDDLVSRVTAHILEQRTPCLS